MTTFSPDVFRAVVNNNSGLLKPNKYRVRFPIPQVMVNNSLSSTYYNSLQTMEYYTDSFDFPGLAFLARNVVRYGYGPSEKKPFSANFNDVMMTVYNDSGSDNLNFFHQWMMLIQNFNMFEGIQGGDEDDTTFELFYKDEYAVDGQVTLLDAMANDVVTIRMRKMHPIHIPEMKLGWAINNDVQRATVIFCYSDWYTDWNAGGTLAAQQQGALTGTQGVTNTGLGSDAPDVNGSGIAPQSGQVDIGVPEPTDAPTDAEMGL